MVLKELIVFNSFYFGTVWWELTFNSDFVSLERTDFF